MLGAVFVVMLGTSVLAALGGALGHKGRLQRAADLAAVSAARSMRDDFSRLFEPAVGARGTPNPRHLEKSRYLARARATAVEVGRLNGATVRPEDVSFPDERSLAPMRVRVRVVGAVTVRPSPVQDEEREFGVKTSAEAELVPPNKQPVTTLPEGEHASGGGYSGPLAYRQGKPMRPDVALAFDRMQAAARRAGVALIITSGYRSDAEQAKLFARHPDPRWVAPPGKSLHRYGTELDLGPPSAYGWLARNARRFGFLRRYSWEPWHYGYVGGGTEKSPAAEASRASPPSAASGLATRPHAGRGADPPGARPLPAFVPSRYADAIARAASRWNVPAELLAAQLYAESNFNPFARSPAGALGIAQFMPATARSYGLRDPFDPEAAIAAQAHLMHDLLDRFGRSIPLALAAYNAGPGAVERYGGVPPYLETKAYVAKIVGLMGGAGALPEGPPSLEVRLVS
jgi:transglycosylase-like protein with SLT domain/D-alanyl-D-alanine carboxypeptidase-like protein